MAAAEPGDDSLVVVFAYMGIAKYRVLGTTADGLTQEQLRRVRVNGERAALDENGYLHEGGDAFCIVIR